MSEPSTKNEWMFEAMASRRRIAELEASRDDAREQASDLSMQLANQIRLTAQYREAAERAERTLRDVREIILRSGPPQWGELLTAVGLRIVDSDGMEIPHIDAEAGLAGAIVSLAALAAGKG